MRIRPTHLIALAGLLAASGAAQAQSRAPERRPLTALDFYHLKTVTGVTLSPDGPRAGR